MCDWNDWKPTEQETEAMKKFARKYLEGQDMTPPTKTKG